MPRARIRVEMTFPGLPARYPACPPPTPKFSRRCVATSPQRRLQPSSGRSRCEQIEQRVNTANVRETRARHTDRGVVPGRMRVGQKNKLTYRWARKGSRPRAIPDQRTQSSYLFGAVCPERGAGAALVLPACNNEPMQLHLE